MHQSIVKGKFMKRILMAVTLTLMVVSVFGQQRRMNGEPRYAQRGEEMRSALALSDDQTKTINAIFEKYHGKMVNLRRDSTLSKEQRHGALKELNGQRLQEIHKVLTAEQQEKWRSMKQENREKKRAMHAARKDFHTDLALSPEQQKLMSDEQKHMRDRAEAVKNDETLSRDQKQKRFKSLRAEHENAVKAILTPEQFAKWKERPGMRDGKQGERGRYKAGKKQRTN